MQRSQLTCPHCGSMLTLAGAITAGAQLTCLVCTSPFTAASPAIVPEAEAIQAPKKSAPRPAPANATPNKSLPMPISAPVARPTRESLSPVLLVGGAAALLGATALSMCSVGMFIVAPWGESRRHDPLRAEVAPAKQSPPEKLAVPPKEAPAGKGGAKSALKKNGFAPKEIGEDDNFTPKPSAPPILVRDRRVQDPMPEMRKLPDDKNEKPAKNTEPKEKSKPRDLFIVPLVPEKEITERVVKAGGKLGSVTVSLAWNNRNDLDLHVVTVSGEKIYYANRRSRCGGQLDVDQNVTPTTMKPVENIFWSADSPPKGPIKIFVHHYRNHNLPDCNDPTPFVVRVQLGDQVKHYNGQVSFRNNPLAFVAEIDIPAVERQK